MATNYIVFIQIMSEDFLQFFGGKNISKYKVHIPIHVLVFISNEKLQIWIVNLATEFDRTACIDTGMNGRNTNAHHVWM